MLLGVLAVVLMGVSWIVTGIVMGKVPKSGISADVFLFVGSAFITLAGVSIGCVHGFPPGMSLLKVALVLGILFVGGIVNNRQLALMSRAMQHGPNGIIWSFIQCGFIVPFILLNIVFPDKNEISVCRVLACIALIAAMIIMGVTGQKNKESKGPWLLLTCLAFLATGISQTMNNLPSFLKGADEINSAWKTAACECGIGMGSFLFSLFGKKQSSFRRKTRKAMKKPVFWGFIAFNSIAAFLGGFFLLYYGMDRLAKHNAGAIAYPLMTGSCILAFDLYSLLVLHEHRTRLQLFALLLCLLGIVGFCF